MIKGLRSGLASDPLHWSTMPLPSLDGGTIAADDLTGRTVLVVNTASLCGFTPQYEALQALWERYADDGLLVLGVPSNDFGGQEYASDGKIKSFCEINYGITFPMLTSQTVKGDNAHPLFTWIARESGFLGQPRWNFYKYLIGSDGHLVAWYSSVTVPDSASLVEEIERQLQGG